jgi:Lon protease-like protein
MTPPSIGPPSVGCAARILKVIKLAKDNFSVILQGVSRIKVSEYSQQEPFIIARVSSILDPTAADGPDRTRVTLEHSGLEAYGAAASSMHETFEQDGAWTATLAAYAARAAR